MQARTTSLEHLAQNVAVTEAAVAIDRERRVIGYLVVEIEAAKTSGTQGEARPLAHRRSERMP